MARHALAAEDKQARRDAILAAALALFLGDTRRFPSVSAVAAEAGVAKGTVYLYFDSKEQIFACLLSREWHGLLAQVDRSFGQGAGDAHRQALGFIERFVSYLQGHPYFLRLDSLGYALLEADLPPDQFWRFKRQFSSALDRSGRVVDTALCLPQGRGLELLMRSYALTRGLWQLTDYPDHLRGDPHCAEHPFARVEFDRDIRQALVEYWRGALAGDGRDG